MSSEEASTSTAESKEMMDTTVEALNMLAQGKRNLLCQEVPTAVQQFQEACQKLSTSYGELAKECADAYYYYGVGLLELSRMESGVLGNALQGVDVDADENADEPDDKEKEQFEPTDKLTEDERDELRDQVYDAMGEDEKKVNSQDSRESAVKEAAPKANGDAEPMDMETEKAGSESSEVISENKSEKNETANGDSITEAGSKKDSEDMVINARAGKGKDEDTTGKTDGDLNGHAPKENVDVQMKTESGKDAAKEVKKQDSTMEEKGMKDETQAEKENEPLEKLNGDASEECKKEGEDKNEKKDTTEKTTENEKELKDNGEKTKSPSKDQHETADGKKESTTNEKDTKEDEKMDVQAEELKDNGDGEKTESPSKDQHETADGKIESTTDEKEAKEDKMDVQDDKDEKKADAKGKTSAGEDEQEKEKDGEVKEGEVKEGEEKEGEDGEADGEDEEWEHAEEGGETAEGEEEEVVEGEEEGGDEENKDGEDPDDVPNLQLAWEMLELSKVIYLKAESKDSKLKAAQSYLKLGEVSMETESYEQAVEDIKTCLKIQEDNLDPDNRLIAETHYHLALAYQLNKQFENAIDHFRAAVKCLESKIEHLKKVVEEKPPRDPSEFVDPAQKAAEEIKDIEKILPDIRDKIEDAQEELRSVDNLKLMAKEAMGQVFPSLDSVTETGFTSTSKSSPTKSADDKKTSDISHLIRKKRKPEDEAAAEDLNKKPRQEGATGDAESKPVTEQNGHMEKPEDKPTETAEPMATE